MAYLRRTLLSAAREWRGLRRLSSKALVYSNEVLRAKEVGSPIVALESTIITHGMPYPQNLETAMAVENIIREKGAIPATVAILKGQLTVGLSPEQIEYLAQAKGVVKASRRDLAPVAAAGLDGATTVAGTIVAAELADIPIFVTGGIGGVHREGEATMDVSADLTELGRSRTLVVCSGVKSILDIGKTLEYLETQGVCVCAFGDSDEFPAFYTRRSGHRAPYRTPSAAFAARTLAAARALHLSSGIVVAVPVPEDHAMNEAVIDEAITLALEDAKIKGIRGKEVTPFILAAVAKATGGKSLATNIALIKNNAKVGADIAVEFNKLKNVDNLASSFNIGFSRGAGNPAGSRSVHTSSNPHLCARIGASVQDEPVLVIGGANVDRTYTLTEDHIQITDVEVASLVEAREAWCASCPGVDIPTATAAQKAWDNPRLEATHVSLLHSSPDDSERARALAVSTSESGHWLRALPSRNIGTVLDPNCLRIAVCLRLGARICVPHNCTCGKSVDQLGRHGLSCARSAGRLYRHGTINDLVRRSLATASVPAVLEPLGMARDDGKRPDGATLVPWKLGKTLVWDATCVDTFAACHIQVTRTQAGAAADQAQVLKRRKYSCLSKDHVFAALAVETLGPWSADMKSFVRSLSSRLVNATGDPKAGAYLSQRISLAIQRGNAASVMGTMPQAELLEGVFFL